MFLSKSGQTALEYLLMIVVMIFIIAAVFIWLQSASTDIEDTAVEHGQNVRCGTTKCTDDIQCQPPTCPTGAYCNTTKQLCQVP
jgi:hypothetical protein